MDEHDKWTEEEDDVERMFCNYFTNLFSTASPSQHQMEAALCDMRVKVTKEMNEHLDRPLIEEEVSIALAQMCLTKAPSLDGLQSFSKNIGNQ